MQTKGTAKTVWNGVTTTALAVVKNFVVDRFSTPQKASNTLSAIGFSIDAAAAYFGGVAAGLALPTFGLSVSSAGTVVAILTIVSLPFHEASIVIDIFNEE